MRVLYLPGYEIPGGRDPVVNGGDLRYSLLVIEALADLGCQVTVINRSRDGKSRPIVESNKNVQLLNYFGFLSGLGPTFDISMKRARLVWKELPQHDLFITNTPLTLELLLPMKTPVIYNASGLTDNVNFGTTFSAKCRKLFVSMIRDPLRRQTWRRSELVNTTSAQESSLLESLGVDPEKIISIPSASFFTENGEEESDDETEDMVEIGKEYARLNVLIVGRFSPAKNQVALYQELIQLSEEIHLVFVGTDHSHDSTYLPLFLKMVENDDRITVDLNVPESRLIEYYERADVVVAMSTGYDPLPTVIYEALSFGRPVISSNHATRTHFDHGDDGFIMCEVDEFDSLRECLLSFHRDRARLKKAGDAALRISSLWGKSDLKRAYSNLLSGVVQKEIK